MIGILVGSISMIPFFSGLTVDGRNPAPVDMVYSIYVIPLFSRVENTSQVVFSPDF